MVRGKQAHGGSGVYEDDAEDYYSRETARLARTETGLERTRKKKR